jgi:outer membrane immunogenic protein
MHPARIVVLVMLLASPMALRAQALAAMGGGVDTISRLEVGANYNYIHANAPPGHCGCFGLNGGSAMFLMNITPRWSGVADITVAHASQVDGTAQNITIINYLFGPRYTRRMHSRYVPYAQVLFGGAKEDVNFQFTINRQSFGLLGGGGVTTRLKHGFGVTIAEVDYVYTRIPNATNNTQNNIRIVTGMTYHFGAR